MECKDEGFRGSGFGLRVLPVRGGICCARGWRRTLTAASLPQRVSATMEGIQVGSKVEDGGLKRHRKRYTTAD